MKRIQSLFLLSPALIGCYLFADADSHLDSDNDRPDASYMPFAADEDAQCNSGAGSLKQELSHSPFFADAPATTRSSSYSYPDYKTQDGTDTKTSQTKGGDSDSADVSFQQSGFYATGQFLYWQTLEDNLAYAIDQPNTTENISLVGKLKNNGFRYDPGVRAAAGYIFSPETWDASLEYTYFHNEGGRGKDTPNGHTMQGLFPDELPGIIRRVSSNVNLQYQVVDLSLKHQIHLTPHYRMQFLVGGRGAWLSQGWNVQYKTPLELVPPFLTVLPAVFLKTTVKNNWKFSGGGIRAGLTFDWFLPWGFGLHFEGIGSAILGWYKNKYSVLKTQAYDPMTSPPAYSTIGKIKLKNTRIVPNWQLLLGVDWRLALGKGAVRFFAGWELNLWSRLSQTYYYAAEPLTTAKVGSWVRESINIQGLTAGGTLEF